MPACGFQKVQGADEIDIQVKMRIFNRRPHTSHGAQVDNGLERLTLKQSTEHAPVAKVPFAELKTLARRNGVDHFAQVGLLPLRRIIVVEVVQAHDLVAAGEQRLSDVTADEAGRAGYQDPSIHQQLFPYLRTCHDPPSQVPARRDTAGRTGKRLSEWQA